MNRMVNLPVACLLEAGQNLITRKPEPLTDFHDFDEWLEDHELDYKDSQLTNRQSSNILLASRFDDVTTTNTK